MNLHQLLQRRLKSEGPVRVGLIGAGKFGSMFLSQVPTTQGLVVPVIADLDPDRARQTCLAVGWDQELVDRTRIVRNGLELAAADDVEVVVEATGQPLAGLAHARSAIRTGKHVVMVNVEADVLAGLELAREAAEAGVVYSMAYGDQPALICEMVDWARACGFSVAAAGKGTRYLPAYHASTPETVWDHYGITAEAARAARMNPRMFNSFLDGTKSAIEMAAVANATGLTPAPGGLIFPPCGVEELAQVLCPRDAGGQLHHSGQVEVVSSLHRDGSQVERDLRWGVFVVVEAPNEYTAACFRQYGLNPNRAGGYAAHYKPFHLIGLELGISILAAVLRGEPTGCPIRFAGDVVAVAKRDLRRGEVLDGEGGYTVWGKLMTAAGSVASNGLPIGLAHGVRVLREVPAGQPLSWSDVEVDPNLEAVRLRRSVEQTLAEASPA